MPRIPCTAPVAPYATHRYQTGHSPLPNSPPSLATSLKNVLNCRADDGVAKPLALAVGAGGGALVATLAAVFNPAASVVQGTLVGVALAATSISVQAHVAKEQHQHRQRWDYINQYPEMQRAIKSMPITFEDTRLVSWQYNVIRSGVQEVMAGLRELYGNSDGTVAAQTERAVEVFYMRNCQDAALLMLCNRKRKELYVCAVTDAVRSRVDEQIATGQLPTAVMRNNRCAFMRLDEVNRTLQGASTFDESCPDQEWRVTCPAPTHAVASPSRVSHFETGELVPLQRRKVTSLPKPQTLANSARVQPDLKAQTTVQPVRHGTTLAEQLARMPDNGVTLRDLRKITEDLAHGRLNGHPVKVDGHQYTASDISIEGISGRGRWRLLHREDPAGHELVGIVDYHDKRTRWWTG